MCKSYGGGCLTTPTTLHRIYTACVSHCSPSSLIQIQLNQRYNPKINKGKGKGKSHPRQSTWAQKDCRGTTLILFLTSAQDRVGCQHHALAAWPPRKRAGTHCARDWVGPTAGLAPTGVPSPDRPARLRYLGPSPSTVPFLYLDGTVSAISEQLWCHFRHKSDSFPKFKPSTPAVVRGLFLRDKRAQSVKLTTGLYPIPMLIDGSLSPLPRVSSG